MIGREKEYHELMERYDSGHAEFIAIYGRRRVGKTYLVNETFRDRITFHHAGLSSVENDKAGTMPMQLENFYYSLLSQGMKKSHRPESWLEAFFMLEQLMQTMDDGARQVVFLDELPWMDTPRSGFITALESFWNNWACRRHNLMLIVCGSANSWVLNKVINNHGGLYGRVTCEIKLTQFTLRECEAFLTEKNVRLSRYEIAQCYMIFGGIPYYLGYFSRGKSLAQNVDRVFFDRNAPLRNEFDKLFASVFENPERMKSIVTCLYSRREGYTRGEIVKKLRLSSGGQLTDNLQALIDSDFVERYIPFGKSSREEYYKLTDPFCIFWLKFVKDQTYLNEHLWQGSIASQEVVTWRGLAFELVCFRHVEQIKQALGISGMRTTQSAWSNRGKETEGTQIDLLIERNDNVINACEIKFISEDFRVDQSYYRTLLNRQNLLQEMISPKISIYQTLITTFDLVYNEYSGIFTNVINLNQLFS